MMHKIGNKINKDIIFPIAVSSLSSLIYSKIGDNRLILQIILIAVIFILNAVIHFYIGDKYAGGEIENNKTKKRFNLSLFIDGLKRMILFMILTFSLLFIVYYDTNFNYHEIPLIIVKAFYITMIWFIGLLFGCLFVSALFYKIGMRMLDLSEDLVPNGESKNGTINYYSFLLSIMTFTYFFKNNLLYSTAVIATIFVCWFLLFCIIGLFFSFSRNFDVSNEARSMSISGFIAFVFIGTLLYLFGHPVMKIVMINLEKPIKWTINHFH